MVEYASSTNFVELTTDETELVTAAGGETMWVTDIWYINGEEVWVYKELKHADSGGWYWTGNWKPASQPKTIDG